MGENSEIIKKVSGWGRTNFSKVSVIKPTDVNELVSIIRNAPSKSLIVRGLGRSYGDAAQLNEGKVIDLSNFNSINLDKSNKVLKAGAGASFEEILKSIIPQGFFLPVSPGTCKITVGGAIASDVHGKNHHVDGSFGNHIKALSIIDSNGFLHKIDPLMFPL